MKTVFYPYEQIVDAEPALTVRGVKTDGKPRPAAVTKDTQTVQLYDPPKWDRAELDLQLACSGSALAEFETVERQVSVLVVAHCSGTNLRTPVRLTRDKADPGLWAGTLELDRDTVRGRVSLVTTLTATVAGVPHRPVAVAGEWTLHADEPLSLRIGRTLEVHWKDFTAADAVSPARDFPKSTHVLAFDNDMPRLVLNSGFKDLEALLKDRKDRNKAEKALHDAQRTGIARSVWMALLADALAAVRVEDGEQPEWPESPWRAEVLKLILPEVMPGKPPAELLAMAATEWRESPGAGVFFSRAEAVIGDIVKANQTLRSYINDFAKGDAE